MSGCNMPRASVILEPAARTDTSLGLGDEDGAVIVAAGSCLVTMAAAAQRTTIRATPIRTAVTLDGRLDDPFWETADSIDDFRQR